MSRFRQLTPIYYKFYFNTYPNESLPIKDIKLLGLSLIFANVSAAFLAGPSKKKSMFEFAVLFSLS